MHLITELFNFVVAGLTLEERCQSESRLTNRKQPGQIIQINANSKLKTRPQTTAWQKQSDHISIQFSFGGLNQATPKTINFQ